MSFSMITAKTLLRFSELSYEENRAKLRNSIAKLKMRKSVFLNGNSDLIPLKRTSPLYDTECFLCHNALGDIVIAFRGSETEGLFKRNGVFKDWVTTDFDATPIKYPLEPGPKISLNKGRWVHRGFWNAYNKVRLKVPRKLESLLNKHKKDKVRIFTTGHSLGGALAILAAADIGKAFKKYDVRTYTFAAPRVGNDDFNKVFAEATKEAYQVIYRGDPVPWTPPIGPNLNLKNKRYQTARNVRYINNKHELQTKLPIAKVALRFTDHKLSCYKSGLDKIG